MRICMAMQRAMLSIIRLKMACYVTFSKKKKKTGTSSKTVIKRSDRKLPREVSPTVLASRNARECLFNVERGFSVWSTQISVVVFISHTVVLLEIFMRAYPEGLFTFTGSTC